MKKNFKSFVFLFLLMIAFSFVLTACNDQPVILDSLQNEYGVVIEGGKFEEGSTLVTNSVTTTSDEGKEVLEILSTQDYNKEGNIYIFDIYVSKVYNKNIIVIGDKIPKLHPDSFNLRMLSSTLWSPLQSL